MENQMYAPRKASATPSAPNNVEAMMQKLRNEVHMISSNLTQVKDNTVRKSVSIMENHLVKNNEVFENHLKEVNAKHKDYVENKTKHYEETISNLKKQLQDRDNVVDKLKGRLDECRTARMEALEDLAKTQKHYSDRVKELESCIAEGRENIILLQNERDRRKSEGHKLQDLESSLESARSEIQTLEDKITKMENELKDKQDVIDQLEAVKGRLETSICVLEAENQKLRDDMEKFVEMSKTKVESEDSVRKMLEDQLAKVQTDWDETKKALVLEQVRTEKLDAELAEARKENGLLKVDVRIESRHKKEFESKLDIKEKQCEALNEKVMAYESANATLASKISSFQDEIDSLNAQIKAKCEEHASLLAVQKELNEQKSQLEQDSAELRNQVAVLNVKSKEVESMRKMVEQKNDLIEEKMDLINQKNRRIQALMNNVEVLKEASSLLDAQLKEFESALDKKLEALQDAEKFKELLEGENQNLREQLKTVKIELNEAKSLKAFTEKRLAMTESSLKSENELKETEVQTMMEKLNVATARNEELSEELTTLMTQTSELQAEKFELRKSYETVKGEKERMTKEISSLVNTVVNMKDEIMALQNGVKDGISKAERYKEKLEILQEKYSILEQSKNTHELMYTTRIDQQEKLIDYLQDQLSALQEKKKKKGIMFTPKRAEKEPYPPTKVVTTPLRTAFRPPNVPATPLCLEREKLAVQELEEKKETLLTRLENLKFNYDHDEDKENSSAIKVKEVLMLEDKNPTKRLCVNCVYLLPNSEVYVIGCDDGLYSMKEFGINAQVPVKIEGPDAIFQIDTLAAAKTAVFIEGQKQELSTVYMGLLKSCAEAAEFSQPKLSSQIVPQTKDCSMFAVRGDSLKDTIVAVASNNALMICAWSEEGLKLVKQIKVKDSITCLLMTPHTVLYGNQNVYEVDTKTFEQEPFLDSTDDAVYYVQLFNESHGSYPVAILDVTKSRGNKAIEPEYLICFQDMGIFVDNFGNRSRDGDVLWSHVPISFEYRHPFLYIFHFSSVEIQKLDEKSYTRVTTLNRAKLKSGEIKEMVVSQMISPLTRYVSLTPKTAPNNAGKSKNGVVISLSDSYMMRMYELTAIP